MQVQGLMCLCTLRVARCALRVVVCSGSAEQDMKSKAQVQCSQQWGVVKHCKVRVVLGESCQWLTALPVLTFSPPPGQRCLQCSAVSNLNP